MNAAAIGRRFRRLRMIEYLIYVIFFSSTGASVYLATTDLNFILIFIISSVYPAIVYWSSGFRNVYREPCIFHASATSILASFYLMCLGYPGIGVLLLTVTIFVTGITAVYKEYFGRIDLLHEDIYGNHNGFAHVNGR